MNRPPAQRLRLFRLGLILALSALLALPVFGFTGGKGAEEVFGLTKERLAKDYTAQEITASVAANVFWPGDEISFTVQVVNQSGQPLKVEGKAETIAYGTTCDPLDGWTQLCHKIADAGAVPVSVDIPAKGFADLVIKPKMPVRFGAYVLVLDLPGHGRQFVAAFLLTPKATPGKVQHPTYALDLREVTPEMCGLWQRLGIKGTRNEWGYRRTDGPEAARQMAQLAEECKLMTQYDITVMLCIEGGDQSTMPFGRVRSHLNDKAEGPMEYPGDFAWMPQYDEDFQKWCREIAAQFGWPKGPVNAMELWNEPWEGSSISGWGADLPRYREMYERMAKGIEEARAQAKVEVLIGGTCSSMNTEDKLFGDGKDTFLKWLDFTSIHYQPMGTVPTIIPAWMERQSPFGPVRAWDTESWFANSEERVAPVIASMRAQGLTRTAGILHDIIRDVVRHDVRTADGKTKKVGVTQAWACGAGIAATQHFIGERDFKELLFRNGLPWIFVFDGLRGADGKMTADDGTVVVVGDLGLAYYGRNLLKFRSVHGLKNAARVQALQKEIAALPADTPKEKRTEFERALTVAEVLTGATLTLANADGLFTLCDYLGNPVPAAGANLVVPLNGTGYFLRTTGAPGSFAKLLAALRAARIDGLEPLEIQARDLTARLDRQPTVQIILTNVLNRPLAGTLRVKLGALKLETATQSVNLAPHETKTVTCKVIGGEASASNTYPLAATFDAGTDGTATLAETLHANVIGKRAITVDGKLDDWKDALPQIVTVAGDSGPNLTEKAWLPFVKFPDKAGAGTAIGYLAYDDAHFYFSAKVADSTPDGGSVRFATRDDDQYYYPEKSYQVNGDKREERTWPAGVRRFSYRKNPDGPFGGDAIQIAFNVLPAEKKGMYEFPAGTMPRFMVYKDTDYEYFLHPVAARFGGGTEIWRLVAPGVPRKHFYPRQGKAEKDGGPVDSGKLAVVQDGNTRIVECALPWTEIPDVKAALDAGRTIKFSFRVTDDKGPTYEMTAGRSVSKQNALAFHAYWETHWANELEFAFEK